MQVKRVGIAVGDCAVPKLLRTCCGRPQVTSAKRQAVGGGPAGPPRASAPASSHGRDCTAVYARETADVAARTHHPPIRPKETRHENHRVPSQSVIALMIGRRRFLGIAAGGVVAAACSTRVSADTYLFFDDFAGPAGTPPDPTKWAFESGPQSNYISGAMGNYTDSTTNCFQDGNSNLVIRVTQSGSTYDSCRITTRPLWYGPIGTTWEARIRIDPKPGTWPAWWAVGTNPPEWPQCGEVDMLEYFGNGIWTPALASTVITHDEQDGKYSRQQQGIPVLDSNWHVYRMGWTTAGFDFYQDGTHYFTCAAASMPNWPFNNSDPMYMILNNTVGGPGGGDPSGTTFPVDMLIDYIRVLAS